MSAQLKEEWWNDFFDDVFASVLLDRPNDTERARTLTFLQTALELKEGDAIFDQCCGTGAVSHILANAGYKAHGVDIITSYINKAAAANYKSASFMCGDARSYVPEGIFDAAINWYTSFGYSADDNDNIRMLECLNHALKPTGKIALEITNMSTSFRNAEKTAVYEEDTPLGRVMIERSFYFDIARGMRGSTWKYTLPDGSVQEKSGISRLYAPRELEALLNKAGFTVNAFYGDLDFSALTIDSPRCICIAQKTKEL